MVSSNAGISTVRSILELANEGTRVPAWIASVCISTWAWLIRGGEPDGRPASPSRRPAERRARHGIDRFDGCSRSRAGRGHRSRDRGLGSGGRLPVGRLGAGGVTSPIDGPCGLRTTKSDPIHRDGASHQRTAGGLPDSTLPSDLASCQPASARGRVAPIRSSGKQRLSDSLNCRNGLSGSAEWASGHAREVHFGPPDSSPAPLWFEA